MDGFFYIGKFSELSYVSPPGRNALRRNGLMSLKRPAAGGESHERDSFLTFLQIRVIIAIDIIKRRILSAKRTASAGNCAYNLKFIAAGKRGSV